MRLRDRVIHIGAIHPRHRHLLHIGNPEIRVKRQLDLPRLITHIPGTIRHGEPSRMIHHNHLKFQTILRDPCGSVVDKLPLRHPGPPMLRLLAGERRKPRPNNRHTATNRPRPIKFRNRAQPQ